MAKVPSRAVQRNVSQASLQAKGLQHLFCRRATQQAVLCRLGVAGSSQPRLSTGPKLPVCIRAVCSAHADRQPASLAARYATAGWHEAHVSEDYYT